MTSFTALLALIGPDTEVAAQLGVTPAYAATLRTKNKVPVEHWPKLLGALRHAGYDFDADHLLSIYPVSEVRAARKARAQKAARAKWGAASHSQEAMHDAYAAQPPTSDFPAPSSKKQPIEEPSQSTSPGGGQ